MTLPLFLSSSLPSSTHILNNKSKSFLSRHTPLVLAHLHIIILLSPHLTTSNLPTLTPLSPFFHSLSPVFPHHNLIASSLRASALFNPLCSVFSHFLILASCISPPARISSRSSTSRVRCSLLIRAVVFLSVCAGADAEGLEEGLRRLVRTIAL
ncbi:hypothetical protein B0J14DRAFT_157148 [Halenospora varia]|nr:hypothetical protein B0J14DRAFT_157148 [Halenospora varia]